MPDSDHPRKRITMRDIAEACGVNHATVSRALQDSPLISAETRRKIREAADRLGYRPDPMVSALVKYRNSFIDRKSSVRMAILIGRYLKDHWQGLIRACREYADRLGYDFEEYYWDPAISGERHSEILRSRGVRGIILTSLTDSQAIECLELRWEYFSVVMVGRVIEEPRLNEVLSGTFQSVRLCLRKVYELGYKRPGLLVLDRLNARSSDRLRSSYVGFMSMMPESMRLDPLVIDETHKKETPERIRNWMETCRPDVVITFGFLRYLLYDMGFRFPENLGFVVLDLPNQDCTDRDYSGVLLMLREIADSAVKQLHNQITSGEMGVPNHPRSIQIDTVWNPGDTVRQVGPPVPMDVPAYLMR